MNCYLFFNARCQPSPRHRCLLSAHGASIAIILACLISSPSQARDDNNQNAKSKSTASIRNNSDSLLAADSNKDQLKSDGPEKKLHQATFGSGCFWCTEAVFQRVKGVKQVTSGYMGGHVPNPNYQMVLTKKTGHAEVLNVIYDPEIVTYEKLLEIFWKTHDPTTLNRQGNDVGPQYRSVIFYHNDKQNELATKYKKLLDESEAFRNEIVTEISPASTFYPAEDYHQNYYNLNKRKNSYCNQIQYKLAKFRKVFPDDIDPQKDKVK
jgi:peptide-methionine (S)-S-oxide reductase